MINPPNLFFEFLFRALRRDLVTPSITNEHRKGSVECARLFCEQCRHAGKGHFTHLRRISESSQPDQFTLAPEPGKLPLGIVARVALCVENCLTQIELAVQQL